jgi:DNA-binding transcriptional regulator YiaG
MDDMSPEDVKRIRLKLGKSQRSFDFLLKMAPGATKRWEDTGAKYGIKGTTYLLLRLLDAHPELVQEIKDF